MASISYEDRFDLAVEYLKTMLVSLAPKKSTNMARSITYDRNTMQIIIGGESAPYAPFTNGPWIAPRWHGKQNPNQGWVKEVIQLATPFMQQILSGEMSQEELDMQMSAWEDNTEKQFDDILEQETAKI